jgi:hypothetical protein
MQVPLALAFVRRGICGPPYRPSRPGQQSFLEKFKIDIEELKRHETLWEIASRTNSQSVSVRTFSITRAITLPFRLTAPTMGV